MGWLALPTIQTGQILSAEHCNRIAANLDYLLTLEAYGSPLSRVWRYQASNWLHSGGADQNYQMAWQGWIRYWSPTLFWRYYVYRTSEQSWDAGYPSPAYQTTNSYCATGSSSYVKIQIDTTGAGGWVDLLGETTYTTEGRITGSAYLVGLALTQGNVYGIRVLAKNVGLFTEAIYQGGGVLGRTWQTLPTVTDGAASTAAHFNDRWHNNLEYLREGLSGPWAPTGGMLEGEVVGTTHPAYRAWTRRVGDYLAYRFGARNTDLGGAANTFALEVNGQSVATVTTDGGKSGSTYNPDYVIAEGLANLNALATPPAKGAWYEVTLRRTVNPGGSGNGARPAVNYLFEVNGAPSLTGWTTPATWGHGDYPAGQPVSDRLRVWNDDLTTLKSRVDGAISFAVRQQSDQYLYRRGDVLLWDGTNVQLYWAGGRAGAPTQGGSVYLNNGPGSIDLRALSRLTYGGYYYLAGPPNQAATIRYGMEVL